MNAPPDSGPRRGLLPRFTLKDGDTFLLADALGDVHDWEDGLFTADTRILSKFELSVASRPVSLLGAAVSQDNTTFIAHLTNRPLPTLGEGAIPQGVIHIERRRVLSGARLYERLTLTNFSDRRAELPVRFAFGADYADIFEVQGHVRPARGQILKADIVDHGVRLAYRGLDGLLRNTRSSSPDNLYHCPATARSFSLSSSAPALTSCMSKSGRYKMRNRRYRSGIAGPVTYPRIRPGSVCKPVVICKHRLISSIDGSTSRVPISLC
jgi:glycogen debranching enzyme